MANRSMMSQQKPLEEKKKRLSFLGKIFRSSKKSANKDPNPDDSFRRQCALYHSFHCTTAPPQDMNASREDTLNFTTLESSAFMDMHKDAGIIFLNKNPISCMVPKEEDRHVQFVPTPMNKYYQVDVKSAPAKSKKNDENKENMAQNKAMKPAKPILRLGKSRENLSQKENCMKAEDSDKLKLNVTYVDGPQVKKTPTIPRTSTKIALLDRKNGSLPYLNLSGITRYGSLPRAAKINNERFKSGNNLQVQSKDYDVKAKLYFPPVESHNMGSNFNLTEAEVHRRYVRKTDNHGCFSIPNLPKHIDQRRFYRQGHDDLNQNLAHRFSMGETRVTAAVTETRSLEGLHQGTVQEKSQMHQTQNMVYPTGQQIRILKETTNAISSQLINVNQTNCQLPNKAINEIGLPSKVHKERNSANKLKSVSESPLYIPLSETQSSNQFVKINNPENYKPQASYYLRNCDFVRPELPTRLPKNGQRNSANVIEPNTFTTQQNNPALNIEENKMSSAEYSHFVNQARMQVIRSSMHSHRRKFMNKMCKYKSKESEDGFSSTADDECSFNCSCSSCTSKFSRDYKKNINRNTLQLNADDKYFFITSNDPGFSERETLAPVPEVPTHEDIQKLTDVHGNVTNQATDTTWYDCNDSLCKTPKTNNEVTEGSTALLTPGDCQEDRLVESIYENITQIINSATKRNFKKQDIQTMFSTPLSRTKPTKNVKDTPSAKKVSRALFSSTGNLSKNQKVNQIPSSKSPVVFSDSVILLQEIFQKLSQECRDLLQPTICATTSLNNPQLENLSSSGSKYVNNLVKNLRTKEISEGDFASIIGGIAQNIFLEAKLKQSGRRLKNSASLPDLTKDDSKSDIQPATSLEDISNVHESQNKDDATDCGLKTGLDGKDETYESSNTTNDGMNSRSQPEGWSKTPTTTTENSTSSSMAEKSTSSKDDSMSSESEMQLLEMAIRLGMGLSPISKDEKPIVYSASPAKATKYKSRDVLSGKGKLKLKIYHNSGLVTVNVMRAAKLNRLNGRDLNPYIKISMVPDCSKRVHWRTSVQKGYKNPVFNQKFSFEILDEDSTKRLVFSVWHRDFAKQRSELVGCMSFSVRHVLDNSHKIDGWYRLLREGFGTQKHFAAHNRNNSCSLKQLK